MNGKTLVVTLLSLVLAVIIQTAIFVRWLSGIEVNQLNQAAVISEVKGQISTLVTNGTNAAFSAGQNSAKIEALERRINTQEEELRQIRQEQLARTQFIPRRPQ
jgi:hypothetical protein